MSKCNDNPKQEYEEFTIDLPVGYTYTNFSDISGKDELHFYCNELKTDAEIQRWVKEFGEQNYVEWRIARTYPKMQGVKCRYKVEYRCQHSSTWYKAKAVTTRTSKSVQCPSRVIIKRIQMSKYDGGEAFTLINLQNQHNHETGTASLLKYRDVSKKAKERLTKLLSEGNSPSKAHDILHAEALVKFGDDYDGIVADRNKVPDIRYCYNMSYKLSKKDDDSKGHGDGVDNREMPEVNGAHSRAKNKQNRKENLENTTAVTSNLLQLKEQIQEGVTDSDLQGQNEQVQEYYIDQDEVKSGNLENPDLQRNHLLSREDQAQESNIDNGLQMQNGQVQEFYIGEGKSGALENTALQKINLLKQEEKVKKCDGDINSEQFYIYEVESDDLENTSVQNSNLPEQCIYVYEDESQDSVHKSNLLEQEDRDVKKCNIDSDCQMQTDQVQKCDIQDDQLQTDDNDIDLHKRNVQESLKNVFSDILQRVKSSKSSELVTALEVFCKKYEVLCKGENSLKTALSTFGKYRRRRRLIETPAKTNGQVTRRKGHCRRMRRLSLGKSAKFSIRDENGHDYTGFGDVSLKEKGVIEQSVMHLTNKNN